MHLHVCSDELSMLKKFEKKHIGYSNLNGKLNSYAHISHDLSCMMKIKPKIKPPLSRFNKKKTRDFRVILKKRNGISLRIKRNQKQRKVLNHYAVITLYSKKSHIFIAIKVIEPQDIWLGIVDDFHYSSDYKLKEIRGFFRDFLRSLCNLFGSSRKKRAIEEKVHVNDTNQNALLNGTVQYIGKEYSFNRKHSV